MASFGTLSKVHIPSSARRTPPMTGASMRITSRFMGSLSHAGLCGGETPENRPQPCGGCRDLFRQHARLTDDGHEVGIPIPARHEVKMHVLFDPGTSRPAQVHT